MKRKRSRKSGGFWVAPDEVWRRITRGNPSKVVESSIIVKKGSLVIPIPNAATRELGRQKRGPLRARYEDGVLLIERDDRPRGAKRR